MTTPDNQPTLFPVSFSPRSGKVPRFEPGGRRALRDSRIVEVINRPSQTPPRLLEEYQVLALTGYTAAMLEVLLQQRNFPEPYSRWIVSGRRRIPRRRWTEVSINLHLTPKAQ